MLKEHLDLCREEDDSINILELNNMNYESEEENENEDEEEDYILPDLTMEGVYKLQYYDANCMQVYNCKLPLQ